jgi:multisubunit Na+/H+ antiporter MnhG subunit
VGVQDGLDRVVAAASTSKLSLILIVLGVGIILLGVFGTPLMKKLAIPYIVLP